MANASLTVGAGASRTAAAGAVAADAAPAAPAADLEEAHREHDPIAIHALLKELMDRNVALQLSTPDGHFFSSTIWTLQEGLRIGFAAKVTDPAVHRLVEAREVSVMGYLDRVKLHFELNGLVLVHGGHHTVLQAAPPQLVYRFQRRCAYRVRTLERGSPTAFFRHPSMPDMDLALRVLDVSAGGCALFVPEDIPPLWPGSEVSGARLELDSQTHFLATLGLRHVTCIQPEAQGARLGCEWATIDATAVRTLQRYIDQTQKRRRMMALD
jgi:flagellar brake protein